MITLDQKKLKTKINHINIFQMKIFNYTILNNIIYGNAVTAHFN